MTEGQIINKYLGWNHKHLGREEGYVDCWGLIIFIYRDLGIEVFDLGNYDERWAYKGDNYFIEYYYEDWEWHTAPVFLDVVLFRNCKGIPAHAGVYLSQGRFIHSARGVGVVIGKMHKYMSRFEGVYRHKWLKSNT